jgi:uncharacterized protein YkwD
MLLLAGIFSAAVITPAEVSLKKDEAKAAFDQLNKVRANPGEYSETIGANLKKIEKRPALIWNDLLVKVAEEKAMDMATRDYLAHENKRGEGINIMIHRSGYKLDESWIEDKSSNYFESIQAGTESGVEMINDLILDEYDKSLGHRKHLLGMGDWNASLVDCGIALAHKADSKFKIYSVVIIAKRAN